ncbi:hypothetical protein C0989_006342 [Termitomyces sp. Mn162]|nr:hypothetical protein C0989_006342 [Termitomyces sp. Mn162]
MEQGWDEDWVRSQLGEVQKTRVLGEESAGQSVGQVGPSRGGRREGAFLVADHGKWRASPLLGVGPSKWPRRHKPMAGPPGFHVYSPTPGGGFNSSVDGIGEGASPGKGGLRHGTGGEGGVGVGMEHLGASGDRASTKGMGLAGVSDAVGGMACSGGGGAGNGARGWFTGGGAGGSAAEGGLAGQQGRFGVHGDPL